MEVIEWFDIVRKSRLVDAANLSSWQNRFTSCSDVPAIAEMMVAAWCVNAIANSGSRHSFSSKDAIRGTTRLGW